MNTTRQFLQKLKEGHPDLYQQLKEYAAQGARFTASPETLKALKEKVICSEETNSSMKPIQDDVETELPQSIGISNHQLR